ncbi:hypothetical protein JCM10212_000862 [Sporobolomyces blumeae]
MSYKLPSLYAFSLPPDLVEHLSPRQLVIPPDHPLHPSNQLPPPPPSTLPPPSQGDATPSATGAYTCALTGASFDSLQALRDHYKSDWYKYNVKLRLEGKPTRVSEQEFNDLVDDLSDSISGSGSSALSDLDEADEDSASSTDSASLNGIVSRRDRGRGKGTTTALSRLLAKQSLSSPTTTTPGHRQAEDDDEGEFVDPTQVPRTALLWFEADEVAKETQYGIYRAILPEAGAGKKRADGPEVLEELKRLQLGATERGDNVQRNEVGEAKHKDRKWTLLMFGGGHFAGMVVKLEPKLVSKGKGKEKDKELVILEKKTFHRYTTRRKQGGSQSAHDSGNGKAKSMGAQLRRHNEMALTQEVRGILDDWRDDINESELVFLRCSKTNYRTFMGYDDAVLQRGDPRIRGFTFPTRRPTINELVRAFTELTKVKTSHLTASALAALDASYLSSITPAPKPPTKPTLDSTASTSGSTATTTTKPKLSKLDLLERDRWDRLVEMVRKGKVEAVSNFLDKYGPELEQPQQQSPPSTTSNGDDDGRPRAGRTVWGLLPEWMEDEWRNGQRTLLHVASAADQPDMVRWMLEVKRADPTLQPEILSSDSVDQEDNVENDSEVSSIANGTAGAGDEGSTTRARRPQQTPYELARSKATRNVFRFVTAQHPDWWDWTGTGVGGARVPSGLDEAKEKDKEAKEEAKREKLREKQREREALEREAELARLERERDARELAQRERDEREGAGKGPKRLGGGPPAPIRDRQMGNLTEEQKARVMREERARAAEARLKRFG